LGAKNATASAAAVNSQNHADELAPSGPQHGVSSPAAIKSARQSSGYFRHW